MPASQDRSARRRQAVGDAAAPSRGERVWSVLHEPTPEDEDARRHAPRAGATDAGAYGAHQPHRLAAGAAQPAPARHRRRAATGRWWAAHRRADAAGVARRDRARVCAAGAGQAADEGDGGGAAPGAGRRQAAASGATGPAALHRGRAAPGCWSSELFGWRRFANRRELAGCLGLAPTPYASGDSRIEQGISRPATSESRDVAGGAGLGLVAPAARERLTQSFNQRFAAGGKRMRRVGIVALARRLGDRLVALLAVRRDPGRGLAQAGCA